MESRNTRGSEWHKWDFHVHTPYSILNNNFGFNPFEKDDEFETNFDNYVKELFSRAINEDINAIGITDYFMIDGYKTIKEKYLNNPEKMTSLFPEESIRTKINNIYVFPNIEFRLNCFVGERAHSVNYHVIFDADCDVDDIENNFLQKIKFTESPDNELTLNNSNIEKLGKTINQNNGTTENPLLLGLKNITVSDSQIRNALNNTNCFKEKFLILVPVDEDLSEISWIGRDYETRKNLYKQANCLLSANKKTRDWAIAKKDGEIDEKEAALRIKEFGSLKPCLWGSDAHEFERMFHPDNDMHCWLKTSTNFVGLKQILYEPDERVIIGPNVPEKNSHFIIDSICFDDDNFTKEPILFNPNLNCIIGGKSTGKSILLRAIAKTINSEHVDEQEANYSNIQTHYEVTSAKVTWKDGSNESRKIIYIPQTFLNNIVDDKENENPVKKIIEETLLQDDEILTAKNNLEEIKNTIKVTLRESVINLCQINKDIQDVKDKLLTLGSEDAYINTIKELESERNSIAITGDVSVSEITEFADISKKVEKLKSEYDTEDIILKNISSVKDPIAFAPEWFEKNELGEFVLSNKYFGKYDSFIRAEFAELNKIIQQNWSIFKTNIITEIQKNKNSKEKELNDNQKVFDNLYNKITINNKIKEINDKIEQENKVLESIKELNAKHKALIKELDKHISIVIGIRKKFKDAYDNYCSIVNEKNKTLFANLLFTAEPIWQKDNFMDSLSSVYNQTYFPKYKERTNYDLKDLNDKEYNDDFLRALIISTISTRKEIMLPLKNNLVLETVLMQLFGDWYTVHYDVKSGNDTIDVMSPGKKASILLELLISKANSECPILIDQPEDDLDNRSIYKDLAQYLRKKKAKRQIIIVTHNANLVLGADADEVIIANQDGADSPNEKYRFEYRTGAIESDYSDASSKGLLYKSGVQTQICDILEGGAQAFEHRKHKYNSIRF